MKEVTKYEAEDGTLFETEREAIIHELQVEYDENIRDEYNDYESVFPDGCEMFDFISENSEWVKKVLEV